MNRNKGVYHNIKKLDDFCSTIANKYDKNQGLLMSVLSKWELIVGNCTEVKIYKQYKPLNIKFVNGVNNKKSYILVLSPLDRAAVVDFIFYKKIILEKLNSYFGDAIFKDVYCAN